MKYTIRKAAPDDAATIQKLNHALFVEEYDRGHDDVLDTNWPLGDEAFSYYKDTVTKDTYITFIAEDDDSQPVGYVVGSKENKFRYRKIHVGELENMIVSGKARRKGVGRMLVDRLRQEFKKLGIDRMYVSAYARNAHAIAFYRSCGFDDFGTELEMKV